MSKIENSCSRRKEGAAREEENQEALSGEKKKEKTHPQIQELKRAAREAAISLQLSPRPRKELGKSRRIFLSRAWKKQSKEPGVNSEMLESEMLKARSTQDNF